MAAWFCHDLRKQPERGRQPLVNWYFRRRRHSNGPALSTGLPPVCKTKVRIVLLGVSLARGWRGGKACAQNRCHWEYRAVSAELAAHGRYYSRTNRNRFLIRLRSGKLN